MTGDWLTTHAGFTTRERAVWELLRQQGVPASPSWIAARLGIDLDAVVAIEVAALEKLLRVARNDAPPAGDPDGH